MDLAKENEVLRELLANALKKIKFMELNHEFCNESINDEEFEKAIEHNTDLYCIEIKHLSEKQNHLELLKDGYQQFFYNETDIMEIAGASF